MPEAILQQICRTAGETNFSGVISIELADVTYHNAYGFRDQANKIPNSLQTRFNIASGTKGFTAVAIARLVDEQTINFDTPAKSVFGSRIQHLHDGITIKHLLGHTSGIGDYLDEENIADINQFTLPIPVQHLVSPADYIPLLERPGMKSLPGEKFSYCNSGYILLALIIELVATQPYQDFVEQNVFKPAGMSSSGFFRSDSLPPDTATGYIPDGDSWKSNIFHLPVRGSGDGGAYSTITNLQNFWHCLLNGQLLRESTVSALLLPRESTMPDEMSYGLGFWLDTKRNQVALEGYDAGVSFHSAISRDTTEGYTIISNTSSGVWPIVRLLKEATHL